MTEKEKHRFLYGEPPSHDEASCKALAEYDSLADSAKNPARLMQEIAQKHGTTIKNMKKHWPCISNSR